ncbi:hypothetical protein [Bosea sp. (in: a-proteobacteria)]|uniref:hypothetical protein n=1 Tax=Bosea sp. (in: a-proteobacteria) TaxID=1871050 RepID=UPI002734F983|nr:hypothetical protein [Bosea sp. (in: a-proteobacteria)]MDP3411038.1 hypothetical protein [Bosea sp. (in: a-proteobacteria)]
MRVMAKPSRAILTVLLSGRHAALGGRSARERAANLARIAAAYNRAELATEKGIGPARAAEVERWLSGQGLSLRSDRDCSVSAVGFAEVSTAGSAVRVANS